MSITLSIVEDLDEVREGLKQFIALHPEFEIPVTFKNAENALPVLPSIHPDIVIVDIGLPGMNGIECIRALKNKIPQTRFLIFTIYENDEKVFEALKAGASGYLLKNTSLLNIIESIKALYHGGSAMSANIARKLINAYRDQYHGSFPERKLTSRENEILHLLSRGLLYKEITGKLCITENNLRQHIYAIYEKLHEQNHTESTNNVSGM